MAGHLGLPERGHARNRHSIVRAADSLAFPQPGRTFIMATQTIGIIVNGATGRIGSTQHLANALGPDHRGRRPAARRATGCCRGCCWSVAIAVVSRPSRRAHDLAPLEHRSRRRAVGPRLCGLLRCRGDPAARFRAGKGDRRRQARLFREAGGAERGAGARLVASGSRPRPQARRGRGQGPSSGHAEACGAHDARRARTHRGLPARIRLVGIRRHRPALPATELELSRRRRRSDPRYVSALALRHRDDRRTIVRVASAQWTATPARIDERGERYPVAVEDSAATLVEIEGGVFGTISSSWATRVRRDDLLTLAGRRNRRARRSPACIVVTCSRRSDARVRAFQRDEGPRHRLSQ